MSIYLHDNNNDNKNDKGSVTCRDKFSRFPSVNGKKKFEYIYVSFWRREVAI